MGNRIFVGNLPWSMTFDKLKDLFGSCGEIEDAIVMSDRQTGRSRGFGFVTFKEESSVEKAIAEMNNKDIEGREIKVNEAAPLEDRAKAKVAEESESQEKKVE